MDRRLLVLALGMFALGTDSFVIAGVLPEISRTFHVSIGAAGQLTTAYAITYAIMAPRSPPWPRTFLVSACCLSPSASSVSQTQ